MNARIVIGLIALCLAGGGAAAAPAISSAGYTRWQAGAAMALYTGNTSQAARALADLAEAGGSLPAAERSDAARFLQTAVCQAARQPATNALHIFAAGMAARRAAIWDVLEILPWTGGRRAIFDGLMRDLADNAVWYDSAMLRLPGFASFCREQRAAPEILAELVSVFGAAPAGLLDALWLAQALYPRQAEQWRGLFEARLGGERDPSILSDVFVLLDEEHWRQASRPRAAYQSALAEWLLRNIPAADWAAMDREILLAMARAGRAPLVEWERKLAAALAAAPAEPAAASLRDCLDAMVKAHAEPRETFAALAPLLAERQELFCLLHAPTNGVMDTLIRDPRNRAAARRMLAEFLAPAREPEWDARLAGLLPRYYTAARRRDQDDLYESVARPIIAARLLPDFEPARAENPVRRQWTSALSGPDGFLAPRHSRDLAGAFQGGLDWEDEINLSAGAVKNYRFIADILLAMGARWKDEEADRQDGLRHAAALASWMDWMLRGGLERPATLRFDAPGVQECLLEISRAWRETRNRFALRQNESGLASLFAGLTEELSAAADEFRRKGGDYEAGRSRRERLVRAVRLTLAVSALIEDTAQLETVLAIMRGQIFALPESGAAPIRVQSADALREEVELFRMLDDDLAGCLQGLAQAPGATRELRDMLRDFAARYHIDVQIGLIATDGFLARLHEVDGQLTPFRRFLHAGPAEHPCALPGEAARESFIRLVELLDRSAFLNAGAGLPALLELYRARLRLSFWRNPLLCGLNANVGLPVLFQLLRDEPLPLPADMPGGADAADWPAPVFLPVLDAVRAGLAAGPDRVLIRQVQYDAAGRSVRAELHDVNEYIWRADRLLRAQELLSFPLTVETGAQPGGAAPPVEALARALAQAAVSANRAGNIPAAESPAGAAVRRRLDGSRRAEFCRLARKYSRTLDDAIAAAECAVMLPNAPENASEPDRLEAYDEIRRSAFEGLQAALDANAYSDRLADGLIAMLRLEACRRGRGRPLGARQIAGGMSARLDPAGRWRLLVEQWSLQHHFPKSGENAQSCREHALPSLECRACRDAVAGAMDARGSELEDLRRFCTAQAGMTPSAAPRNRWEAIAQLAVFLRRLDDAAEEIAGIGPDAVKSAWYLSSQSRRAMELLPPHWTARPGWTDWIDPEEPLAAAMVRVARFYTITFSELLPIHGNLSQDDLLGDSSGRPANGDALAVFSMLDAFTKSFLLDAAALERRLPADAAMTAPVGTLAPRELTAVHSAMQPLLALGVWTRGTNAVKGGGTLMQFVVNGRQYAETFFDLDIVLESGGSFTLAPRGMFEEALRSWDLLMASANPSDGDEFIYNAWFGDLRGTVAGQGGKFAEQFNLDRFLISASEIPGDRRYEAAGLAPLRAVASTFQGELSAWLDGGGGAAMGRGFAAARTPMALAAIAERMADRLGLYRTEAADALPALAERQRDAYAGFCRHCLFDTGAGRPVFPSLMRESLAARFSEELAGDIAGATNGLAAARARFSALFEPYAPPDAAAGQSPALAAIPQFGGLAGLYRRALADTSNSPGYWFTGDFVHAYMQLVSEIYWRGARDAPGAGQAPTVSFPWRLDETGKAYINTPVPEDALNAPELHNAAIRDNFAWRAAGASRYADVPFIRRFFGGRPLPPPARGMDGK